MGRVIAVGDCASLKKARTSGDAPWNLAIAVFAWNEKSDFASEEGADLYPAFFDSATGAILTLSVPDPSFNQVKKATRSGANQAAQDMCFQELACGYQCGWKLGSQRRDPWRYREKTLVGGSADEEGFVFVK